MLIALIKGLEAKGDNCLEITNTFVTLSMTPTSPDLLVFVWMTTTTTMTKPITLPLAYASELKNALPHRGYNLTDDYQQGIYKHNIITRQNL